MLHGWHWRSFVTSSIYRLIKIVPPALPYMDYSSDPEEAFLQVYDPTRDSDALKRHPEEFEHLRGNYPLRREISFLP